MKEKLSKIRIKSLTAILPYLGVILIFVFFMIASNGRLLSPRNITSLVSMCFPTLIGSSCLMFLMAQGGIDLSIGATMALSGILGAMSANISIYLLLPVTIIVGIVIGYINYIFVVKFQINDFLLTLSMSFVLSGTASFVLNASGIGVPREMLKWSSQGLRIGVMIGVYIICAFVFGWTPLGRQCKAIGANEKAAVYSGINVKRLKSIAFIISGGVAGLLAFFSVIRAGIANNTMGGQLPFDVLIVLLIGGFPINGGVNSNIRAPIIGSITITILMNGLTLIGISEREQQLIRGILLLLIVTATYDRKRTPVIK